MSVRNEDPILAYVLVRDVRRDGLDMDGIGVRRAVGVVADPMKYVGVFFLGVLFAVIFFFAAWGGGCMLWDWLES